jgi:hypothetical protein
MKSNGIFDKFRKTEQPSSPTDTPSDIPTLIKQLGDLRDSGLLTDEEFEAKKAELLAKL